MEVRSRPQIGSYRSANSLFVNIFLHVSTIDQFVSHSLPSSSVVFVHWLVSAWILDSKSADFDERSALVSLCACVCNFCSHIHQIDNVVAADCVPFWWFRFNECPSLFVAFKLTCESLFNLILALCAYNSDVDCQCCSTEPNIMSDQLWLGENYLLHFCYAFLVRLAWLWAWRHQSHS